MSNKRLTEENRCPRCRLNTLWCYCDLLSNIAVSNKISAVVHSSELQYTSNTAHLLVSTLSTGRLYLYTRQGVIENLPGLTSRSGTAYLLFPHEDAIPIEEVTPEGGVHLIVPDGSWRRARKMCQRHPLLRDLPRVFVRPQGESRYFARRQGRSHGVCTYEAVAWALKALEGEEIYEKMMKQFGLAMGALWRSRQGNPDALEPNGQDVYPGPK